MAKPREPAPSYVPNDIYSQDDWDAIDNPPLTELELARVQAGTTCMPSAMAEAFARRVGRPKAEHRRVPVSLRLPPEVLSAYRAGGPGWQTRMTEVLAAGLVSADKPDRLSSAATNNPPSKASASTRRKMGRSEADCPDPDDADRS